jgi:hypothetical protein
MVPPSLDELNKGTMQNQELSVFEQGLHLDNSSDSPLHEKE